MKFVYIVVSLFMCGHVFAATLLTSCPTGYTALREKTVFATAAVKCESGYAGSTTLINAVYQVLFHSVACVGWCRRPKRIILIQLVFISSMNRAHMMTVVHQVCK